MSGLFVFFFFNDTATTEIYTLSLHDALPISYRAAGLRQDDDRGEACIAGAPGRAPAACRRARPPPSGGRRSTAHAGDRKSTRLNSSHLVISYAVFCLKKKNYVRDTRSQQTTH